MQTSSADIDFKELFLNAYPRVRYYAFSYLKDMQLAENVAQDTFYKVWQNRANLDFSTNLTGYLLVIARNLALNVLRKDKNKGIYSAYAQMHPDAAFNLAALEDESAEALYSSEVEKLLEEGLSKMSEPVREAFLLSRNKGLTYNEIALQTGVSQKTVEGRISTALKILREVLKDYLPIIIGYLASWVLFK